MKFVDVHMHLESSRFDEDRNEVVNRAKKAGAVAVVTSGTSPENNRKTLEFSKRYDLVKCSFGFYPIGNFDRDLDSEIEWIEENKDSCVAVGEIGMDFNEGRDMEEKQKEIFMKMLNLAKKIDKPVVIHSRKAENECLDVLESEGMKKVVMHCFGGRKSLIRKGVELGFYFSVPPVITRLEHFKMLVNLVPLEQLLTETDAPYLSPVYGERNEPANIPITIKEIAKIKNLSEEEVAEQIFKNVEGLLEL